MTPLAALPMLKEEQKRQAPIPAATGPPGQLLGKGRERCWVVGQEQH